MKFEYWLLHKFQKRISIIKMTSHPSKTVRTRRTLIKKTVFLFSGLCLMLTMIHFIIPGQVAVVRTIKIVANPVSISRLIADPAKMNLISKHLIYQNDNSDRDSCNHDIPVMMVGSSFKPGVLKIQTDCNTTKNHISLFSISNSSCTATWSFNYKFRNNVFIKAYSLIKLMRNKDKADALLQRFKEYAEIEQNIYGINIKKEKVKDTLVVVIKEQATSYPSVADVYSRVHLLQKYISTRGAKAINFPMLHVQAASAGEYEMMVAIPTNIALPDSAFIQFNRLVSGNILTAQVKGGHASILQGIKEMENYIQDHQMNAPALPFESLVTDRLTEPDSLQWITKLYYPVF